jgi:hypothetical protein
MVLCRVDEFDSFIILHSSQKVRGEVAYAQAEAFLKFGPCAISSTKPTKPTEPVARCRVCKTEIAWNERKTFENVEVQSSHLWNVYKGKKACDQCGMTWGSALAHECLMCKHHNWQRIDA